MDECQVCKDPFVDPRLLPCLHTACWRCILDMDVVAKEKSQPLTCLICNEAFSLSSPLPSNYVAHSKAGLSHLPQNKKNKQAGADENCEHHVAVPLSGFCERCSVLVCAECLASGAHSDHDIIPIEEAASKYADVLQLDANELLDPIPQLDQVIANITAARDAVQQNLYSITADITTTFDTFKSLRTADKPEDIVARRDQLLVDARRELHADIKLLQFQIDDLLVIKDIITTAARQVSAMTAQRDQPVQFLRLFPKIMARLTALHDIDPETSPVAPNNLRYYSRPISLGDQAMPLMSLGSLARGRDFSRIGKALASIGSHGSSNEQLLNPRGLCATSDGNLVIADTYNHRVQVLTADGKFVRTIARGFLYPIDVAAEPSGAIWVCSTLENRLCRFAADSKTPDMTIGCPSPSAMAICSNGDVVVTCSKDCAVRRYSPTGTLRWTYKGRFREVQGICEMPLHYELVVVDVASNRLQILSGEGEELRSICVGVVNRPRHVAAVGPGAFAVTEVNGISIWTLNGALVHAWGGQGVFQLPYGVTMLPDGRIAVDDQGRDVVHLF